MTEPVELNFDRRAPDGDLLVSRWRFGSRTPSVGDLIEVVDESDPDAQFSATVVAWTDDAAVLHVEWEPRQSGLVFHSGVQWSGLRLDPVSPLSFSSQPELAIR